MPRNRAANQFNIAAVFEEEERPSFKHPSDGRARRTPSELPERLSVLGICELGLGRPISVVKFPHTIAELSRSRSRRFTFESPQPVDIAQIADSTGARAGISSRYAHTQVGAGQACR